MHRGIGEVNFLLQRTRLFLGFGNQTGHSTENIGIDKNQCDEQEEHDCNFGRCTRSHFVATECEDAQVEDDEELVSLGDLLHIVKAIVLVPLHVDEVKRWRPDRLMHDNREPQAPQAVQDQHECDQELQDFECGFILFIELKPLHKWTKSADSCDLENFTEGDGINGWNDDLDVTVRDGGQEINHKHALKIVHSELLGRPNLHTLRVKVSCAETDDNIENEQYIDDQIQVLIAGIIFKLCYDVLKGHGKRVEDSQDQDHQIPLLLVLIQLLNDRKPARRHQNFIAFELEMVLCLVSLFDRSAEVRLLLDSLVTSFIEGVSHTLSILFILHVAVLDF